jgi:iron(III) transport system ATP-binding protein
MAEPVEPAAEPVDTDAGRCVLELDDVTKRFDANAAVDGASLSVYEGELLTLLGPSGCGKTTTLRLLAGLEEPTAGTITLAGDRVAGPETFVEPERRDVGLVFQEYALFPHLTAAENVAFGLPDREEAEREARVDELLSLVGLSSHRDHRPDQLSGGQQQRIALARSLAPEPAILLLDEPFSNLDVALRKEMREEVRAILKEAGVTAVSVTHDQEEALSISDRIAVVNDGQIEQVGRPQDVFQHPTSRFVADFLGQAGFVSGRLRGDEIRTAIGTLDRDMLRGLTPEYDGAEIDVLVRPDDLAAAPLAAKHAEAVGEGRIVAREYTGPSFLYRVELDSGERVQCQHNHAAEFQLDQRVAVELTADHPLAWFPAE